MDFPPAAHFQSIGALVQKIDRENRMNQPENLEPKVVIKTQTKASALVFNDIAQGVLQTVPT